MAVSMFATEQTGEVRFGIPHLDAFRAGGGQAMDFQNRAERDSGKSSASLRVLLVDDDPHCLEACCALLSSWGIHPVVARNGGEALELVRGCDFDIVLMDVVMPVLDGLAATREIRRLEKENPSKARVPVVAYTSRATQLPAAACRLVGLSDVLKKPSDADAMSKCLSRWCGTKFSPRYVS